jgi:hypothetical protein
MMNVLNPCKSSFTGWAKNSDNSGDCRIEEIRVESIPGKDTRVRLLEYCKLSCNATQREFS